MMNKRFFSLLFAILVAFTLCLSASAEEGDTRYINPDTDYEAAIIDDSDILTPEEESKLIEEMIPITEYGHIIFWSTEEATFDEIDQAKQKRYELYGNESSGIFAINMKMRKVTFQSDGAIHEMVSSSYARSITDNVSGYASSGDYYSCAAEAYAQILTILQGNSIAEPMKYISYAVIALMLAFVLVVGVVFSKRFNPLSKINKEQSRLITGGSLIVGKPSARCTETTTRAWVEILRILVTSFALSGGSSGGGSSGGGSSGGSSGGGGGGGGSSSF